MGHAYMKSGVTSRHVTTTYAYRHWSELGSIVLNTRISTGPFAVEFAGKGTVPGLTIIATKTVGVEAHECEQLAQSRYAAAPWPGIELATS